MSNIERLNFDKQLSRRDLLKSVPPFVASMAIIAACSGDNNEKNKLAIPTKGSEPTSTSEVLITPTEESIANDSERALLNLGNWEIAVVGWEILDKPILKSSLVEQVVDSDNKLVAVQLVAKNISNELLDSEIVGDESNFYRYRVADAEGNLIDPEYQTRVFPYIKLGGVYSKPYLEDKGFVYPVSQYVYSEHYFIPPGFSIPIGVIMKLDKSVENFGLAIEPLQSGLPNPSNVIGYGETAKADPEKIVRIGEVGKKMPLFAPEANISKKNEPQNFTRNDGAQVIQFGFTGFSQPQRSPEGDLRQYLLLNVTNISESPGMTSNKLSFGVGEYLNDYQIQIYLKDGRVITPLDFDPVYPDNWSKVQDLGIGMNNSISVPVSSSQNTSRFPTIRGPEAYPQDNDEFYGILDFEDCVTVLTDGEDWIAWKNGN